MGANGSGKSTILKLAQGKLRPQSGDFYLNESVPTAYVPQGLGGFFSEETLLDNFNVCNFDETSIRQHLGAALIRKDKVHEPIENFSQGELMRAAIVRCILLRAEFLFLDEPTSHLDIESINVLEHLLQSFKGGFVLVSHDRSLVANVAETVYVLEHKGLRLV
jgi:ATP-binding cassette subfamily F protein 3